MNTLQEEFLKTLERWQTWLRIRRALSWALPGLVGGLAAALGFSLAVLGQFVLNLQQFTLLSILTGISGMGAAIGTALVWPLSRQDTARFFDRHFDLYARSATALELVIQPELADATPLSQAMASQQLADAVASASLVSPRAAFFFKVPRLHAVLVAALLAALTITGTLSKEAFNRAQTRQAFQAAVEQEIEQIEATKEEVLKNETLTPQEREEIARALERAIEDLKKADSPEQAFAAMQEAEGKLQSLDSASTQQQAQALRQAGQEILNQSEGSQTVLQEFAQALASGSPAAAAQALSNLELEGLTPEEIASLIEQLEQTANAVADSNPDLAEQLREAAEQLQQGNTQQAQQALQQASGSLQSAAGQLAQASAARQAASQLSQGRGRLVQAGQSASSGSQSGQGQGQGQGEGSGSGTGQGSSQGEGSGTGGGAGSGTSSGSEGQMNPGGSGEISQNNGPGDGGERLYEQIYAPRHLGGSGGDEVTLPRGSEPGDVIGTTGTNPGSTSPSLVPYENLPQNLIDTYRKAFQDSEIPTPLREIIKYYYSNP